MRLGLAVAAGCVALAGCESVYSAPKSGPVAQLVVSRAKLTEAQQAKLLYLGGDRLKRDWIGDGIFYEYDTSWPVAAEARTYLEVETLTYAGYTELYCSTFYSFTPRAGRTYVVTPVTVVKGCGAEIVERESGAAPGDLVQVPAEVG